MLSLCSSSPIVMLIRASAEQCFIFYSMPLSFQSCVAFDDLNRIQRVLSSHACCRTKHFCVVNGEIWQQVEHEFALSNCFADLTCNTPYCSVEGPVLRVFRCGERFCLSAHHVLLDRVSILMLRCEITSLGECRNSTAFCDETIDLGALGEERKLDMLQWWESYLQGCYVLHLSGTRAMERSTFQRLPHAVAMKMHHLSSCLGVSLFSAWHSLFAYWAGRQAMSGEGDALVCTRIQSRAGRIGVFSKHVVLRYKLNFEADMKTIIADGDVAVKMVVGRVEGFLWTMLEKCGVSFCEKFLDVIFAWEEELLPHFETSFKPGCEIRMDGKNLHFFSDASDLSLSKFICYPLGHALVENDNTTEWTASHQVKQAMRFIVGKALQRDGSFVELAVGLSSLVGVNCNRGEMEAMLVSSLCARGIPFLPLDSEFSVAVVKFRIEDTCCMEAVVEASMITKRIIQLQSANIYVLDRCLKKNSSRCKYSPIFQDTCYVVHTSGSTGKPKGVVATQQSVCSYFLWHVHCAFQACPGDIIASSCSVSWDTSMMMRFWPLLSNFAVCIVKQGAQRDIARLGSVVARVTMCFFTPSQAQIIKEHLNGSSQLRLLMIGGESLSKHLASHLTSHPSKNRVWNIYGPTETTLFVTCFPCLVVNRVNGLSIPIGRCVGNVSFSLSCKDRLERGSSALFVLQGEQISGGYFGNWTETRRCFTYDAEKNNGLDRCYDTGDQVRLGNDGVLEFVGRLDNQVKIGGQRIEISAVEMALLSCQGVKNCVVVLAPGDGREAPSQLIAAVVGNLVVVNLMHELRAKLSSNNEVPSRIVVMDSLPLNSAGKVDKIALRKHLFFSRTVELDAKRIVELDAERMGKDQKRDSRFVVERVVRKVLSCDSLDFCKTFWEQGGSSFLAMKLVGELKLEADVEVSVLDLMRDGSLSHIVELLERKHHLQKRPISSRHYDYESDVHFARATFGQGGLYVIWKMDENATNYTEVVELGACGHRTMEEVVNALYFLAGSHAALRTVRFIEGRRVMFVEFGHMLTWRLNWIWCDDSIGQKEILRTNERREPWDLEGGSGLLRARGWRVEHKFFVDLWLHHCIGDEWSEWVLKRDFQKCLSGLHEELRPVQIWEFSEWEYNKSMSEENRAWWKRHLRGCRALVLTGQLSMSHRQRYLGLSVPLRIQEMISRAAREGGVTIFSVWLASFAVWAWKCMERDEDSLNDVLVVSPYGRRDQECFQGTVGYLLNMLVYRFPEATVCSWLGKPLNCIAQESSLLVCETIEKGGYYPFSELVRQCDVRDADRLLDVMFVWTVSGQLEVGCGTNDGEAKNALTFYCDGLLSVCKTSLLDLGLVVGKIWVFGKGLEAEDVQVNEWNGGEFTVLYEKSLQNVLANRFDYKTTLFPSPFGSICGVVVALCLSRGKLLFLLLGEIICRGAAFLLIDHANTGCVSRFRIEDSRARWCIVDSWKRELNDAQMFIAKCLPGMKTCKPVERIGQWDMSYLFYTSGSTGTPKGVMIKQGNVVNYFYWLDQQFSFRACKEDVILWQSAVSFDQVLKGFFLAFASESRLACVASENNITSLLFTITRCSMCFCVPTLLVRFFEERELNWSTNLRMVMTGGEAVSKRTAMLTMDSCKQVSLWNGYGPTETTVNIFARRIFSSFIAVGRPFPNSSGHLTMSQLRVAGKSVSAGYKNQLAKTKVVFTIDTCNNDGSLMMYDTGDKMKQLVTGELQYEGRLDKQVKVNGQRVELGAVEDALMSCAGVAQGVVLCIAKNGNSSLVACVTPLSVQTVTVKEEMRHRVARHEMPHKIIVMDSIPVTGAGKIDRRELLRRVSDISDNHMRISKIKSRTVKTAANTEATSSSDIKVVVSAAMQEVLGVTEKDLCSGSFWDHGGTSVTAMVLDRLIYNRFGARVGMSKLLRDGSLEGIMQAVSEAVQRVRIKASSLPKEKRPDLISNFYDEVTLFARVTAGQEGLYVIWKMHPFSMEYTVGVELQTSEMIVRLLFARHSALRTTRYLEAGRLLLQRIEKKFWFPQTDRNWILAPWDLQLGPSMCRIQMQNYLKESNEETNILLLCHHSILDGSSMQVLLDEVRERRVDGPRAVQFFEFVEWECSFDFDVDLGRLEQKYASVQPSRLVGTTNVTDGGFSGCRRFVTVSNMVKVMMRHLALKADCTLFNVWQSMFSLWVWRQQQGKSDAVFVGPFGRREGWEGVVGFLIAMIVYCYPVERMIAESLDSAHFCIFGRDVVVEALETANVPFQALLRKCPSLEGVDNLSFTWMIINDTSPYLRTEACGDIKGGFGMYCFRGEILDLEVGETATFCNMMLESFVHHCTLQWSRSILKVVEGFQSVGCSAQLEEWITGGFFLGGGGETFQAIFLDCERQSSDRNMDLGLRNGISSVLAVFMRRSQLLISLVHAAICCGSCFVPFDVNISVKMAEFLICDVDAECCFVDFWRKGIQETKIAKCVKSNTKTEQVRGCSSDMIVIFYTSGSTGRPKGVILSQDNLSNLACWMKTFAYQLSPRDSLMFHGSVAFDPFLETIAWPVLSRCRLVIVSEEVVRNPVAFRKQASEAATVIDVTPSFWALVIRENFLWGGLKLIVIGGESLSLHLLERSRRFCLAELWNEFGPAEATMSVTGQETSTCRTVSIGRPFYNVKLAIQHKLLVVTGRSVSLGYKNLKSKTNEAFMYCTRDNDGNHKSFLTADVVKHDVRGTFHFLGRSDGQVKVNGRRVELEAVEGAVMSCPGVQQCCVIVAEVSADHNQLVAFVVGSTTTSAIHESLLSKAAEFDMPHRIVMIDTIPLTSSGKVDMPRLKAIVGIKSSTIKPSSRIQRKKKVERSNSRKLVEDAIKQIFGREVAGNIWRGGGSSLMAMSLSALIEASAGVKVGLGNLLLDGSVDAIAKLVEDKMSQGRSTGYLKIRKFGDHEQVCVVFSSFGLLSQTAASLVNDLKNAHFSVHVCEFAGLALSPKEICRLLVREMSSVEIERIHCIIGHSAGGIWAFEFALLVQDIGSRFVLCFMDSYLPPFELLTGNDLLRFVMSPFQKILNLPALKTLHDDFLQAACLGMLISAGVKAEDAIDYLSWCGSQQNDVMHERMNLWTLKGFLAVPWIFVSSSETSEDNASFWKYAFAETVTPLRVKEGHADMMRAGDDLIDCIRACGYRT